MSTGKTLVLSISIGGIIYLAANDHEGWGWLIVLALIVV